jgi:hypothetical protein
VSDVSLPGRARALQILGLSDGADAEDVRAAHRALRAHIEARLAGQQAADFRAARRAELSNLDQALQSLLLGGAEATSQAPRAARRVPRWVLGWAVIATICLAGLVAFLSFGSSSFGPRVLVDGGGDGAGGEGSGGFAIDGEGEDNGAAVGGEGDAESAGVRAKLVVESDIEGAALEVQTRGEAPEIVADGAADESVYWLSPGAYALEVSHADCRDAWHHELDVVGGEELHLRPELCQDTGWMLVRSNVAADELTIDGQAVGSTGETKHAVAAGEHEVRVEKPGYQAWQGIVDVEGGQVLGIRPRLEPRKEQARPKPQRQQVAANAPREESDREPLEGWHEDARQWLLARYDVDQSGALDSREELEQVPCEQWLGLEQSYDQSNLGLSLTRFYGFDGEGWRSGALGVSDDVRDLAYDRMSACGLR